MDDPYDLARFVTAQRSAYSIALAELREGRKRTHWMWFVFPQLKGLGTSPMAERYGLAGIDEARAYLQHELLGPRLFACVNALLGHASLSAADMLGNVDALKLRSSLTLFASADPSSDTFAAALDRFFDGARDPRTVDMLGEQ